MHSMQWINGAVSPVRQVVNPLLRQIACMYACMYVCMYVCMHACMHAFMHLRKNADFANFFSNVGLFGEKWVVANKSR